MPNIAEPFARPPKLKAPKLGGDWDAELVLDIDFGFAELSGRRISGVVIDLDGIERFEINRCELSGVSFLNADSAEVTISDSVIDQSDLSRLRLGHARAARFTNSKLVGLDLAAGVARDCEFADCVLRLANLRSAQLQRIAFNGCTLDSVDAFGAELQDISFARSTLIAFNVDRVEASGIDLRDCTSVEFAAIDSLKGFCVAEHQLPLIAHQLATAVGLTVDVG